MGHACAMWMGRTALSRNSQCCRSVFMEKKRRARWRTSVCLNLAMVFERADEVILPAAYSFVALSFAATPSDLANITLARALVQAVCSPVGGVAGIHPTASREDICLGHTASAL